MSWIRWPWQRRKAPQQTTTQQPHADGAVATATITRSGAQSGRLSQLPANREPRDELLRFVRDTLNAQGARVRVEEDDLVVATLTGGDVTRYTTTLGRARAEDETILLAEGSAALTALFDETAQHARLLALNLADAGDLVAVALAGVAQPSPSCGRCVSLGASLARLSNADTPQCAACPLRDGHIVLHWATLNSGDFSPSLVRASAFQSRAQPDREPPDREPPDREPPDRAQPDQEVALQATVIRQWIGESVELTLRVGSRDRQGRHDEWLRIAIDATTGRRLTMLTLQQAAQAQAGALDGADSATLRHGQAQAQSLLTPTLEAASAFLQQRAADDYQRRVADVTIQHERLRREQPDAAREIAATLERELTSIAEVYGVEVEARLEGACLIRSPMAEVALTPASHDGSRDHAPASLLVDVGRSVVLPPDCGACGKATQSATVCPHGHILCGECARVCASCGRVHCPKCADASTAPATTLTACATCGELVCEVCAQACGACGLLHCPEHLWACKGGDTSLCLLCAALCKTCDAPLCVGHTLTCGSCGDALCAEHALACKQCGQTLCAEHASRCVTCQQPLCARHTDACEQCGQMMCAQDTFACLGCGRQFCSCAVPAACETCQIAYCAQCRGETNTCPACRSLSDATEADLALLRRVAEHEPAINARRAWQAGHNARATVFSSRGVGRRAVYVVTPDGEIVGAHRSNWLGR